MKKENKTYTEIIDGFYDFIDKGCSYNELIDMLKRTKGLSTYSVDHLVVQYLNKHHDTEKKCQHLSFMNSTIYPILDKLKPKDLIEVFEKLDVWYETYEVKRYD